MGIRAAHRVCTVCPRGAAHTLTGVHMYLVAPRMARPAAAGGVGDTGSTRDAGRTRLYRPVLTLCSNHTTSLRYDGCKGAGGAYGIAARTSGR